MLACPEQDERGVDRGLVAAARSVAHASDERAAALGVADVRRRNRADVDERVFVVLETIAPPVLLLSVSDRFMYLSLTNEKNTSTTQREVSAILSHSIPYLRLVSVTANVARCDPFSFLSYFVQKISAHPDKTWTGRPGDCC